MKILTMKTSKFCLVAVAMLLSLWGSTAFAESYNLTAGTTTVTMPDGRVITMWGYGLDGGPITVPGPPLLVTDGTLTINLTNNLAEPTSIVINGQNTAMTPVWIDPATGAVTSTTGSRPALDVTSRVRSFTHEAAANGGTAVYTWAAVRPGTYLYQSGTHPSKQVQMGLYGAVKAEVGVTTPLEAYPAVVGPPALPAVTYTQDVILLFSEIDPALHDAVAPTDLTVPTFGTAAFPSTIDYKPKYFLINGKPYTSDQVPLNTIAPAVPAAVGDTILLRVLNAGLENRVAVVQGQTPTLYAEDGNRLPFALQNNALLLPAGKTLDATFTSTADGYIPIFDRRLGLSNAGSVSGGMLAYLQVGAATQPLTVTTTGIGVVKAVSAPGGINCGTTPLPLCSQNYLLDTDILLSASAGAGSTFNIKTAWTGCDSLVGQDCLVKMSAAKSITANFNLLKKVTILTPNGSEPLLTGSRFTITWAVQTGSTAVTFNLAYSLDNGITWKRIARGVTGTSYNWLVPTLAANKNGVLIRVVGINAAGKVVSSDRSNAPFSIHTVKLTAPNGGEILTSGTEKIITWTTGTTVKPVERVVIAFTKDGGLTWVRIADTNVNTGSFTWTVPPVNALRKNCKVRVTLRGAGGVLLGADRSDKVFRIQPVAIP